MLIVFYGLVVVVDGVVSAAKLAPGGPSKYGGHHKVNIYFEKGVLKRVSLFQADELLLFNSLSRYFRKISASRDILARL